MLPDVLEIGLGPRVGGQVEDPLPRGPDELPRQGEDAAAQGLGPLHHPPTEGRALVKDEQVVGEDFQLQVGRVGPEAARAEAVEAEVGLEIVDRLLHVGPLVVDGREVLGGPVEVGDVGRVVRAQRVPKMALGILS